MQQAMPTASRPGSTANWSAGCTAWHSAGRFLANATDASKIALSALVALCRHHGIGLIDCQQNTGHLAFLGGREIPRSEFLLQVEKARNQPAIPWAFDPVYWNELLPTKIPKA